MNPNYKLSAKQASSFNKLTDKRLKGIPVAYLLGYKYFYGLKFKVNRSVLIPRPETEWLVDQALEIVKTKLKKSRLKTLNIAEVGTGSGCIAISIDKSLKPTNSKKVKITATGISKAALKIAQNNAKLHNSSVNFSKRDLLTGLKVKYDLIIANLPYVPLSSYQTLKENLKHEPMGALTDGTDDFILIQRFLEQASRRLTKNGVILIETDPASIKLLKAKARRIFPLSKIRVYKDIHRLERFIVLT